MAVEEPQIRACEHSCEVALQVEPDGQSALTLHGAPGAIVYQLRQFCSSRLLVAVRSSIIGYPKKNPLLAPFSPAAAFNFGGLTGSKVPPLNRSLRSVSVRPAPSWAGAVLVWGKMFLEPLLSNRLKATNLEK